MSSTARMTCGSCHKTIKFPAAKIGQTVRCPGCKSTIKLADHDRKPPAPAGNPGSRTVAAPKPPAGRPPAAPSASTDIADIRPEHQDTKIAKFIADGQSPDKVGKLLSRVETICASTEEPEYIAVQHLPGVMSPDAVVFTNRRAIVFRAKMLGRMDMVDVPWLDVKDIRIKEGVMGATVSVVGLNGHAESVDHLPKPQARHLYRIGQEREELMREHRRDRKMEEDRNAANQVVVNAAPPAESAPVAQDVGARLQKLKAMHDAELIDDAEYASKKAEIIADI